jgi:hypothetical protein
MLLLLLQAEWLLLRHRVLLQRHRVLLLRHQGQLLLHLELRQPAVRRWPAASLELVAGRALAVVQEPVAVPRPAAEQALAAGRTPAAGQMLSRGCQAQALVLHWQLLPAHLLCSLQVHRLEQQQCLLLLVPRVH